VSKQKMRSPLMKWLRKLSDRSTIIYVFGSSGERLALAAQGVEDIIATKKLIWISCENTNSYSYS